MYTIKIYIFLFFSNIFIIHVSFFFSWNEENKKKEKLTAEEEASEVKRFPTADTNLSLSH